MRRPAVPRDVGFPTARATPPLAELTLDFGEVGRTMDYRRGLDLEDALASLDYRTGDARFRREAFASHPDQLVVLRMTADRPGVLACRVALSSLLRSAVRVVNGRLLLTGKAPTVCKPVYDKVDDPVVYSDIPGRGMAFAAMLEVRTTASSKPTGTPCAWSGRA